MIELSYIREKCPSCGVVGSNAVSAERALEELKKYHQQQATLNPYKCECGRQLVPFLSSPSPIISSVTPVTLALAA